jgi:soluble lytic murein transglycosylase
VLSTALFRQKKYKEAGESYLRAGDLYMSALSFFRSGDYDKFKNNIKRLESNGDERAGGLLISYASDRRRKGYIEDALNILSSVSEGYPSERERALWERGWTFYISKDYERAFKTFSELSQIYKKSKYIYWKARTAERLKDNSSEIYSELQSETDFYGLLAMARTKKDIKRTFLSLKKGNDSLKEDPRFKKFRLLNSVGLKKEAVEEMIYALREFSSKDEILTAAYELVSLGEYRRAIALVHGLPEPERPFEILYPIAFWEHIDSACSVSAVDPLLVLSVIREESRYDPNALSPAGAIGVMQIMPRTAEHLAKNVGVKINGTRDIYDLGTNIRLGVFYLKNLIDDFGSVVPALAEYYAGEYKVREWLSQRDYEIDEFIEDIPYKETREYVKRIITSYLRYYEFLRAEPEDFSILKMPQLVD